MRQLELPIRTWGGRRAGAGRRPANVKAGASHLRRPSLNPGHPLHVTIGIRRDLPGLRKKSLGRVVFAAFAKARERFGVRLTHFSIQRDHLHLIVEASGRPALSRAMQGLGVRLARRLNAALGRKGSVLRERFHARALKSPLEVRRVLLYVMNNYRRHLVESGARPPFDWADPYSSVDYFDGFARLTSGRRPRGEFALGHDPPVTPPKTWLLRTGWRRRGLLRVQECPGQRR
jgi:REP element-mobilizing transposase RayT